DPVRQARRRGARGRAAPRAVAAARAAPAIAHAAVVRGSHRSEGDNLRRRRTTMATAATRPLAVITGASCGIGYELARQCVEHEDDAIVGAEDPRVEAAAERLRGAGTAVEAVRADLATYEGNEVLARAIRAAGGIVDALLLNAGVAVNGAFVATSLEEELRVI